MFFCPVFLFKTYSITMAYFAAMHSLIDLSDFMKWHFHLLSFVFIFYLVNFRLDTENRINWYYFVWFWRSTNLFPIQNVCTISMLFSQRHLKLFADFTLIHCLRDFKLTLSITTFKPTILKSYVKSSKSLCNLCVICLTGEVRRSSNAKTLTIFMDTVRIFIGAES